MIPQAQTVELKPLTLRAAMRPESCDPEKRTAELVMSTGARVLRFGWDGKYYEELSLDPKHVRMDRLKNGAPLLDAHNSYELEAVIGVVESARLADGQLSGTVRFARAEDDAKAEQAWRKVRDGILRNVSIGFRVHKFEKVEGGADKVPVYRATDWEPFEVSLVPMGADDGAKVRAAVATNTCQVIVPGDAKEDAMAEETRAAAAPPTEEPQPAPPAEETRAGITMVAEAVSPDELARRDEILAACEAAGLSVAFARTLISEKLPVVAAQRRIIEELMQRGQDAAGPVPGPSGVQDAPAGGRPAGVELDARARQHMAKTGVSYREAFRVAQREQPALARQFAESLQRR